MNVRYLDGSNNKPEVRSSICSISRARVSDNRTRETLTTAGGDTAPDNAVKEFTSAPFVAASYIEHGQHLNRPTRKSTALFIVKPDHPNILVSITFTGVPLRLHKLAGSAVPRGGLLNPPHEAHVETKE